MIKNTFWIENIGDVLCEIRGDLGLTQDEVAKRIGVSRHQMSNIENGKCCLPVSLLIEICKAYNVEPSNLFLAAGVHVADKNSKTNNNLKKIISECEE